MKKLILKIFRAVGIDLHSVKNLLKGIFCPTIMYNVNNANFSKRCLLVYLTAPFKQKVVSEAHQNFWQCKEMARIIGNHGFNVDAVDYEDKYARLKHDYDLVIGLIPRNVEKFYKGHLKQGAVRIAYLTSMNLAVTSGNEEERIANLFKRKGVLLKPRRYSGTIRQDIENFDAVWYIGNSHNYHSYDCFKMPPVYYIKNNGYTFDWADTSLKRDPKKFVFFGSLGAVHKGLDLLLDVFSQFATDCVLYVCSGYENEEDFCKLYHKELYKTPNIIPMGFVDIKSEKFKDMISSCAYTILPSCAEGCAGSILTVMSGGLIPIVSDVCGFDEEEAIILPDCNIETIAAYVKEYSMKSESWILEKSHKSVEVVKSNYGKENFLQSVEVAIEESLKSH